MTRTVKIGNAVIGGGNPVLIQSMTTVDARNFDALAAQITALRDSGCELVRIAAHDEFNAKCFSKLKYIGVPLIADVHYDADLAVNAIEHGADKVRINPGNVKTGFERIVAAAKMHGTAIRVGANAGSLGDISKTDFETMADLLVLSALENIKVLEDLGFYDIVVSLKSSDVKTTVNACRKLAKIIDYPQHIGVTEAGNLLSSAVKSSVGIGTLLMDGIGDTIRVSVTGDPVQEIGIARQILTAVGLRKFGAEIISCPTCSRCTVDLSALVAQVSALNIKKPIKIAVMGCPVNGPGEAKAADFGLACANGKGVIFAGGSVIKTCEECDVVEELNRIINL